MKHENRLICEVFCCPGCSTEIFCTVVADREPQFYLSQEGTEPIDECPECRLDLHRVSREDLSAASERKRSAPVNRTAGKKEMVAAMLAADVPEFASRAAAERAFDAVGGAFLELIESGTEVRWPGVGSFKIKQRKARRTRNPQTGAMMNVPAKKAVTFRPAKRLREGVANL
jgi:DNA-binding protein HU-beta